MPEVVKTLKQMVDVLAQRQEIDLANVRKMLKMQEEAKKQAVLSQAEKGILYPKR